MSAAQSAETREVAQAGIRRCEVYAAQCIEEAERLMEQAARLYQDAGQWQARAKRYAARYDGDGVRS